MEAGVGGFRSPPSAMELLVDWGVWGPWRDPEPAAGRRKTCEWRGMSIQTVGRGRASAPMFTTARKDS